MKKTLHEIFLAIFIGLGIPSLIFGALTVAGHYEPPDTAPPAQTSAQISPQPSYEFTGP